MKKFALVGLLWVIFAALPAGAEQPVAGDPNAAEQSKNAAAGCMPDGGCCGACAAAQAQAQVQGEHKQEGGATKAEDAAGGCPCKRAKQQTM